LSPEFAIAYDEGRLIGVLEGSGGIADALPGLVERIDGAVIVADPDPDLLIERLLTYYRSHLPQPPLPPAERLLGRSRPSGRGCPGVQRADVVGPLER